MHVFRSMVIDASAEEVWAAVRRFDGVAAWNPGITASKMESGGATEVGGIRRLDAADGSVWRETLLAHSDLELFYAYDIVEGPLNCENYVSTHRFIPITDGDRTLGIWEADFDCHSSDADELERIVGDAIYMAGMAGLNDHLKG